MITTSRRRLPHIYRPGHWVFVTFHLHGSLPRALYPTPGKPSAGKAFVWMDRYLDCTRNGPMFLRQPEIAALIVSAVKNGATREYYELRAFAVMANHVHLLIRPIDPVDQIMQRLKGGTAREANKLLARIGKPFWQRESYDHCVRNEAEAGRIAAYIENNPVAAGLVNDPRDYQWSSAWQSAG